MLVGDLGWVALSFVAPGVEEFWLDFMFEGRRIV